MCNVLNVVSPGCSLLDVHMLSLNEFPVLHGFGCDLNFQSQIYVIITNGNAKKRNLFQGVFFFLFFLRGV